MAVVARRACRIGLGEHLMLEHLMLKHLMLVRVRLGLGRTMHPVARATSRSCGAPRGCGEHGVGKEPGAGSPAHTRGWQKRLDANEPGTSVPS